MIKAQLHIHIKDDPVDNIPYDWKKLIDRAKDLKYDVLAITCHKKIIFPSKAKKYAQKKGILLIKGIEIEIDKKHIIILNADKSAEKIRTFEDLKKYKNHFTKSFILAPHPYFPTNKTLKKDLEQHIELFDGIEYSYFHTRFRNYNKKAEEIAEKYNKPLIGTSDCHVLKYIDVTYSIIDYPHHNQKPIKVQTFLDTLRKNKIKIVSKPLSATQAAKIFATIALNKSQKLSKKLFMI